MAHFEEKTCTCVSGNSDNSVDSCRQLGETKVVHGSCGNQGLKQTKHVKTNSLERKTVNLAMRNLPKNNPVLRRSDYQTPENLLRLVVKVII